MTFVTMGDSKYFYTMLLNVQNIRRFYPDAEIYVGDVGLSEDQKERLNVNIIDMTDARQDNWFIYICKPILLLQVATRTNDSLCFMDGDAILIRTVDIQFKGDLTVTVRKLTKYGKVNAGVIFFNNNIDAVLGWWLRRAISEYVKTGDRLSEQWALNYLCDSGVFDVQEVSCDQYNFPAVERGISDNVCIVHLKSHRSFKPEYLNMVKNI